jgi:hypothetical protein
LNAAGVTGVRTQMDLSKYLGMILPTLKPFKIISCPSVELLVTVVTVTPIVITGHVRYHACLGVLSVD